MQSKDEIWATFFREDSEGDISLPQGIVWLRFELQTTGWESNKGFLKYILLIF